jgi:hypothetical protein
MKQEGEEGFHTISLALYDDPFPILKIGKRGRVHLAQKYAGYKILTFLSYTKDINIENCKVNLDKLKWKEIKQVSGKNKGNLLNVFSNGDICAPYIPEKYFPKINKNGKIFREDEDIPNDERITEWYIKVYIRKEEGKLENADGNTQL